MIAPRLALLPLFAASSLVSQETTQPPNPPWREVLQTPSWVALPTVPKGRLGFVMRSASNATAIARGHVAGRDAAKHARKHLTKEFHDLLGTAIAEKVVDAAMADLRAHKLESRFQEFPGQAAGNTFVEAWGLYSVSTQTLTDAAPKDLRGKLIEDLAERTARKPWAVVKQTPDWVTRPPQVKGRHVFVLATKSNLPSIARGQLDRDPGGGIRRHLMDKLAPAIGADYAKMAIDRAMSDVRLLQRASRNRVLTKVPGNTTAEAWVLFSIPALRTTISRQAQLDRALQPPAVDGEPPSRPRKEKSERACGTEDQQRLVRPVSAFGGNANGPKTVRAFHSLLVAVDERAANRRARTSGKGVVSRITKTRADARRAV